MFNWKSNWKLFAKHPPSSTFLLWWLFRLLFRFSCWWSCCWWWRAASCCCMNAAILFGSLPSSSCCCWGVSCASWGGSGLAAAIAAASCCCARVLEFDRPFGRFGKFGKPGRPLVNPFSPFGRPNGMPIGFGCGRASRWLLVALEEWCGVELLWLFRWSAVCCSFLIWSMLFCCCTELTLADRELHLSFAEFASGSSSMKSSSSSHRFRGLQVILFSFFNRRRAFANQVETCGKK